MKNKEIEELLNELTYMRDTFSDNVLINLLNKTISYIEQLEKENEFLKLDNPNANIKHFEMLKENKRKIDNLRYQNKQLQNKCESLLEDRKQLLNVVNILQNNRDKVIEVLEKSKLNQLDTHCKYLYIDFDNEKIENIDELIDILKGDSDEFRNN